MSKSPTEYYGTAAYTARSADTTAKPSTLGNLTREISHSLHRPGRKTLALIDKALAWLRPFESPQARVSSAYERRELLELLTLHRMVLTPYIDVDRIERHLIAQTTVKGPFAG